MEGAPGEIAGLGLLDHHTVLGPHKTLRRVRGGALGTGFEGYEMHMGETHGGKVGEPFAVLNGERPDGAISADGWVMGTFCYGLLASGKLRRALLEKVGAQSNARDHAEYVDAARQIERYVDIDDLIALAGKGAA